jgi:uncharacterized protein YbjT (DUF2867 family)
MSKTALVFGATGMIGAYLLEELLKDPNYETVRAFVRKPLSIQHSRLKQIVTDFHSLEQVKSDIKGDVLFCCLGTTIRNTPSKEGRRFVDKEIPIQLASIAEENKIPSYLIVSSIGASASTSNFYLRLKGEMEKEVSKKQIGQIVFMRPSFLMGDRNEFRPAEGVYSAVMRLISPLMLGSLKKFKPIHGRKVALAMIALAGTRKGISGVDYEEIVRIANAHKKT